MQHASHMTVNFNLYLDGRLHIVKFVIIEVLIASFQSLGCNV